MKLLKTGACLALGVWMASYAAAQAAVTQERLYKDGVWISRPAREDERVHAFMAAGRITTLEEYTNWLKRRMRYRADGERDEWARPAETLARHYGDCEDYSILSAAVLKALGYEPRILVVDAGKVQHAICAFATRSGFAWLDQDRLVPSRATNLQELARRIFAHYPTSRLFSLDPHTREVRLLFTA